MRNGAWTHPECWADVTGGDHVDSVVDTLPSHNGVQLVGYVAVEAGETTDVSKSACTVRLSGCWGLALRLWEPLFVGD